MKIKKLTYEKVPFGYEKKPIFANFPFHTLGYENIGCFSLMAMRDDEPRPVWMSLLITH